MSKVFKNEDTPIQTESQVKRQKRFIEKAKQVHGDRYDYSRVVYKRSDEKIKIICPEHGEFEQVPKSHLKGYCGCKECVKIQQSEEKRHTKEEFVKKAKEAHGDKYDYSKVEYVNTRTKVKIICPIHGEFEQSPDNHIQQKQGCPKCGHIKKGKSGRLTTKEFIEKAKRIHGNRYDYSLVKYEKQKIKITIICPIHGEFEQVPNDHLNGYGCYDCGNELRIKKLSSNTNDFIKRSKQIHGDKYDYSKVEYKNNSTKVKIICPIHGEFEQTAGHHLRGCGCKICAFENSKFIQGKYKPKYPEKYSGNVYEIIYRSSYELKAFQMIEENKNIISWGSETAIIPYFLNGNLYRYIVDLKIEAKDKTYLIEIKPECKLHKPKYDYLLNEWEQNQAKWKAARNYCKERNWEFEIWTERELGI